MKIIVKYFRNRAIKASINAGKCIMPDISSGVSVALIVNCAQLNKLNDVNALMGKLFSIKKFAVVSISDSEVNDAKNTGCIIGISKNDINFLGLLKNDVLNTLTSDKYDIVLNLAVNDDEMFLNDYIVSQFITTFKVSFDGKCKSLYNLVIDSKKDDVVENIKIFHDYLKMLLGKR